MSQNRNNDDSSPQQPIDNNSNDAAPQPPPPSVPSLKESIKNFVTITNNTLSSLELKYQGTIQQPMTQVVHRLANTPTTITEKFHQFSQHEKNFDYCAITVISVFFGLRETLRHTSHGRFSARAQMMGVTTTMMYGGLLYGVSLAADKFLPEPNETSIDLSAMIPKSITDLWKPK